MTSTRSDWGIPAALIALSLVPAIAGIMRVAQLAGGATVTPENARFVAAPLPVLLHIPSVVVFSILGALQFSAGLRRRRHGWHRAAGRILIPCGVVAALTGLWMTCVYPWPPGDGPLLYIERLVFGSAMLLSIARSVIAIRRRDFLAHGRWMLRAYAIGLGAGTQVLTHVPWFLIMGDKPGEGARAVMMGAGWVINVAVAEWIIRRERTRARTGDVSHRAMRRVVLGMTLLIGPAVASGQSHFRRTNPPGPHAVGLRVVEQYDLSRGYRGATAAYTGNATRGTRARPIQTLVWYPAEAGTGLVVTAGTYLRLGATADDFGHTAAERARLEAGYLAQVAVNVALQLGLSVTRRPTSVTLMAAANEPLRLTTARPRTRGTSACAQVPAGPESASQPPYGPHRDGRPKGPRGDPAGRR